MENSWWLEWTQWLHELCSKTWVEVLPPPPLWWKWWIHPFETVDWIFIGYIIVKTMAQMIAYANMDLTNNNKKGILRTVPLRILVEIPLWIDENAVDLSHRNKTSNHDQGKMDLLLCGFPLLRSPLLLNSRTVYGIWDWIWFVLETIICLLTF